MRKLFDAATLALPLVCAACSDLGVMARIDPPKVATYEQARCTVRPHKKEKARPINLDCFTFPNQPSYKDNDKDQAAAVPRGTPADAAGQTATAGRLDAPAVVPEAKTFVTAYDLAAYDRVSRNRLAAILIKHADDQCARENADVVANQTAVNLFLDVVSTGLSAAATIVTGSKADSILTGTATFASGVRGQIDADVYRGQVTQAITASIAGEQDRLRTLIDAARDRKTDDYTVDDMVRQVNQYYQTCSFYKGLELVLTSAREYPKLAEAQTQQRAAADVRVLDARLKSQQAAFEALAKRSPDSPFLAGLQQQAEATQAALTQRQAILYPSSGEPAATVPGEATATADAAPPAPIPAAPEPKPKP